MPLTQSDNVDPQHYHEAYVEFTDAAGNLNTIVFDAVMAEDWNPTATVTEHPVEDGANVGDHVRVGLMTCTIKVHVTNEPSGSNFLDDPTIGPITIQWPQWVNNLDLNARALQAGGLASEIVGAGVGLVESATPLGNLVAQALIPTREVTATGNIVPGFDTSESLQVAGTAVNSLSDAASSLTFELVAEALEQPGYAISVPTTTGNIVQFDAFTDYAQELINAFIGLLSSAQLFHVVGSKMDQTNMILTSMAVHRGEISETGTGAQIEFSFKQIRIVSTNTVTAPIATLPRGQTTVTKGSQDPPNAAVEQQKSVALLLSQYAGSGLKNAAAALFGSGGGL
jgi:hypothetical protein